MVDEVRVVQRTLRDAGHLITFDWTDMSNGGRIEEDWGPYADEATGHALKERAAVLRADVLVLVAPAEKGRGLGCFLETGIAIGAGIPVLILGNMRESVFWYLPRVWRVGSSELLPKLDELAARRMTKVEVNLR
jgi:hypothetical protein